MFAKAIVFTVICSLISGCYGVWRSSSETIGLRNNDEVVERKLTRRLINQQVFLVSAGDLKVGDSVIDVARYETALVTGTVMVTLRSSEFNPLWPQTLDVQRIDDRQYILTANQPNSDIYRLYRQLLTLPEVKGVELQLDYTGGHLDNW